MSDTKTTCCVCGAPVIHHSADEGTQSMAYDKYQAEEAERKLKIAVEGLEIIALAHGHIDKVVCLAIIDTCRNRAEKTLLLIKEGQ